jgi:phosphoesterase RecJ-like protein
VATHFYPDGDAVGALLAFGGILDQLGRSYILAVDDACPVKYSFLPGFEKIRNLKNDPLYKSFDRFVVLDAGALLRTGSAQKCIEPNARILNIDHHFTGDYYGDLNVVDTIASATSEILHDLTLSMGLKITPEMAQALYVGILTDTGRFRFANTTPHAFQVCANLVALGVDSGSITEQVFYNMPIEQVQALAKTLASIEMLDDGRICLAGLMQEDAVADTEGFVEHAASIKEVLLAGFYCEVEPDLFKVSLRSRCEVDVSAIATSYGGGGHRKAAGFRFRGKLELLKARLEVSLRRALAEPIR